MIGFFQPRYFVATMAFAAVAIFGATPAAASSACVFLPPLDFVRVPPPAKAGFASGFAGVWEGTWSVRYGDHATMRSVVSCARLYISVLGTERAYLTYCYAFDGKASVRARCFKVAPQLTGDRLAFTTRSGLNYTFTLIDGVLKGACVNLARLSELPPRYAIFHRLE
jgi:hypothetical protein